VGDVIELDAVEFVLEGAHGIAVCFHLLIVATLVLHDLVNYEMRVSLTLRRLMLVSMAIRRAQRRASYSATLLDAGKCKCTSYLICSLRGEMKSRPAPTPVFITDPSK
jgi:hypothetical protein